MPWNLLPDLDSLLNSIAIYKVLISALLVLMLSLTKRFLIQRIMKNGKEERRNQINTIKQLGNGLLFVSLILVWSSEVQNLALSFAAFMVAIVFATREFLQCLLGFLYYLFTRPFRVGDWIEIDELIMGEVYSIDWLKVTLIEVNSQTLEYTGKTAYVPNNWLVSKQLKNLNFIRRYSIYSFKLTISADKKPMTRMTEILKIVTAYCETFSEVAARYKEKIERFMETEFITVVPQVNIRTNEYGMIELHISFFCPTERAADLENSISRDILMLLQDERQNDRNNLIGFD